MFLVDTNVLSEGRKGTKADPGVVNFLIGAERDIFLPVQVLGELRFGIEKLKRKGDFPQARRVEKWFQTILTQYAPRILTFDQVCAHLLNPFLGDAGPPDANPSTARRVH
jgi:hypothetical protein